MSEVLENKEIPLFKSLYSGLLESAFPEKVRKLRKANGVSLEKFAEAVSVSVTTIQKWERGSMKPAERSLNKICAAFGDVYSFAGFGQEEVGDKTGGEDFTLSR